jgi:two-component system sensor histidine kinase and response regulator WspE
MSGAGGTGLGDFSLLELFRAEVAQHAAALTDGILGLEQDQASPQRLESLMRAAHSIKGAARLVDMPAAGQIAHLMEDSFVAAQQGQLVFCADHVDAFLNATDMISCLAADADPENWVSQHRSEFDAVLAALTAVPQAESEIPHAALSGPAAPSGAQEAPEHNVKALRIGADQLNRLMGLAGESMQESRWLRPYAESLLRLKYRQAELIMSLDWVRTALEEGKSGAQVLDHLREAQLKAADCRHLLADRLTELEEFDHRLMDMSWRLQREVVASRMRQFGDGVRAFPRMLRDVARSLGKEVQLQLNGLETMVDREILEKIEAPLNHLLRNAVDHGIESPEQRLQAGKPARGTIKLNAYHHAGLLSIVVEDDGCGVDMERLRNKVLERGLVSEAMAAELSEAELLEFMFLPGFTTRDTVTEISGRGVGLDVVHDAVHEMRGSVRSASRPGQGMRFHLQLPLTLSVIPALLVHICGEAYAFPLARIERTLKIERSAVESIEGRQFISVDGDRAGLVFAAQVLELEKEAAADYTQFLSVVVLGEQEHKYALVVDHLLGKRDLVVHVLPAGLGKIRDISAAALLEDGSPTLIVDIDDMLRSIEHMAKEGRLDRVGDSGADSDTRRKRILVVDDSITVREVERKLLSAVGYQVDVAVDGMDGWNAVRGGGYDLVITDVDMPRMDGIELVRLIKQDLDLRLLPVMIVSYKDREEDRYRGLNAGADYYMTKGGFHDDTLRQAVRDLIGDAE